MNRLPKVNLGFLALLSLLALVGCRTASSERLRADTQINGQPVRFIYDTGADATFLFTRPAKRLGLKVVNPPFSARPAPGKVLFGHTELCRFSVGGESYKLKLNTLGLPWPVNRQADVEGAIGWADMRDDYIEIDAPTDSIRGVDQLPPDTNGWFILPIYPRTGVLALQTPRPDGRTGVWEIDTGNDEGISLSRARWKEWRATHPRGQKGWSFNYMPGSGMGIKRTFTPDEFVLGPLTWKKVVIRKATRTELGFAASGDVLEGSLGIKALRQLDLILDQKKGLAYLRSHPEPAPKRSDTVASTNSHLRLSFREQEFFFRAQEAFESGDFEKALDIIGQFLEKQPDNWSALEFRGMTRYVSRQWGGALEDFSRVAELNPDMADYAQFYLWIIRARTGQRETATLNLAAYLGKLKGAPWEIKVGSFLLDRLNEADFLRAAAREPGDKVEHQCEAWFYAGMKRQLAGDAAAARAYFRKCLATGRTDGEEYNFAAAELKTLN
jgi:hypothetical protein